MGFVIEAISLARLVVVVGPSRSPRAVVAVKVFEVAVRIRLATTDTTDIEVCKEVDRQKQQQPFVIGQSRLLVY